MFSREFLDEVLPIEPTCMAVGRIISFKYRCSEKARLMMLGLHWMAEFVENDRFPTPGWKTPNRFETALPIMFEGLQYKAENQYLGSTVWTLGTRCWFTTVNNGYRMLVASDFSWLTVARAIIVMKAAERWRDTDPKIRSPIEIYVEHIRIEFEHGQANQGGEALPREGHPAPADR